MFIPVHLQAMHKGYTVREAVLPQHFLYHNILPLAQTRMAKTSRMAQATAADAHG